MRKPGGATCPAGAVRLTWPAHLAYLDSFLSIGVVWLCHHAFSSRIRQVDPLLAWGNLMVLLRVAFVPFPNQGPCR